MIERNREYHIDEQTKTRSRLMIGYYYREWSKQEQRFKPYQFLGTFQSVDQVPEVEGIYFLDGEILYFINYIDNRKVALKEAADKQREKKSKNSDKSLDYTIFNQDNDLKILVKRLLNGFSPDDLKKLFEMNVRDYNNFRSALLGQNPDLSWNRFIDIIRKLGLNYELIVYLEDNTTISNKDDIKK